MVERRDEEQPRCAGADEAPSGDAGRDADDPGTEPSRGGEVDERDVDEAVDQLGGETEITAG